MPFDFNFYSALLLLPVVHGSLFFVLLLFRFFRKKLHSDLILALIVFLLTLFISQWMLGFAGWYDAHNSYTTFMFYMPFQHFLFLGPLIYYYFRCLSNQEFQWEQKHFLHFIPAGIYLLSYLYCFVDNIVWDVWIQGGVLEEFYGTIGPNGQGNIWLLHWIDYIDIVVLLTYAIATFIQFKKYRQYLNQNFSTTEEVRFPWLHFFLVLMIFGISILVIFKLLSIFYFEPESYVAAWYKYAIWGLLLYAISIGGYYTIVPERKELHFEPEPSTPEQSEVYPKAANSATPSALLDALQSYMSTEKPYLNPDLNLNRLAEQVHQSPTQISKVLNQELGLNFNDFVNQYRVEAVKKSLVSDTLQHLSLLGIAFECGFNSKATFNRVFKKWTQQSPSAYIKSQRSAT